MQRSLLTLAVGLIIPLTAVNTPAQKGAARKANEEVNSAEVRQRPGLLPDGNLLFNGWGMTPAGTHVPVGDMPLKMLIAPDKKMLVAVSAGFNRVGLTLIDLEGKRVAQFLPLPVVWNGLAFSKDGKRIFVSGGDSGNIHVFNYAGGKATADKTVKISST